jgi:hypothetical protein
MVMRGRALLLVGVMLTACTPGIVDGTLDGSMGGDDTHMDGGPVDGDGLTLKLVSKSGANPVGLPEQITPALRIDEVRLYATSVRVNGNGGTQFTTKTNWDLRWRQEQDTFEEMFAQAPTGRYSTVEVQIQRQSGSGAAAVEIKGRVQRMSDTRDFDIDLDNVVIPVEIMIDTMLAPGQAATITVDVDMAKLLAGIDWEAVSLSDGDLVIDDDDMTEVSILKTNIAGAFTEAPIQ